MKNLFRTLAAGVAAVALAVGAAACSGSSSSSGSDNSTDSSSVIAVVASTNVWGSLAEELGGKYVDVSTILNNTGVDAHEYEPTTNDIAKIEHAQVVIVNGAGYDDWAVKAAESGSATVINAADEGGKSTGDNPHVWFSSAVRNATAKAITAAYEKLLPADKDYFEKLYTEWTAKEEDLENEIAEVRKDDPNLSYAAIESVGGYLAEELGLSDVTPSGYKQAAANESEPSASDLDSFEKLLKAGDTNMLIMNSQEPSTTSDTLVAAADSGNIPVVDLTENMPSDYKSLTDWISAIVKEVKQALEQGTSATASSSASSSSK
ncbi:metal ABC transporter solute-binding protein, Zn/Mn family [Bifidobacterium choloepi]|uniref:ABC transporter substrate-binding protein n=1 Tax=Bifidobacterium choloepi TaxID=2614131 RepID=A0A6I5MZN4_9BIFI|nr:zinc ABC transporter substrate-binding protein [Bifidobacterium choloepi]NEG69686.1 ABC transporter substrate-binding protein [Bifidobacterium choloepi]